MTAHAGIRRRVRSLVAGAVVSVLLLVSPASAEETARRSPREAPSYESPILALLLLPVNLLIRMASVLEPEKAQSTPATPSARR